MASLPNKVVLLTGCSSGIGYEMALSFLRRKYTVFATARNVDALEPLVAEGIKAIAMDVVSVESIRSAVEEVLREVGHIDVLVNNAGVSVAGSISDLPLDTVRSHFETNVIGLVAVSQAVIPSMAARRAGMIVNIGSIVGTCTTPWSGIYCSSKAAVHSISDAMRVELKPYGIQVVVVAPGGIRSNISRHAEETKERAQASPLYNKISDFIYQRAVMSQQNATPAKEFAEVVVKQLVGGSPSRYIFTGHRSGLFKFLLRWLPFFVLDRINAKVFGLKALETSLRA